MKTNVFAKTQTMKMRPETTLVCVTDGRIGGFEIAMYMGRFSTAAIFYVGIDN